MTSQMGQGSSLGSAGGDSGDASGSSIGGVSINLGSKKTAPNDFTGIAVIVAVAVLGVLFLKK